MPAFLKALLEGDRLRATAMAQAALAAGGSRLAVFADLLQPALYEVGELWYAGRIGVADEHRATAIVAAIVDELPPTPRTGSHPRVSRRCLLAATGEEQHVLGLTLVGLAMEDEGWTVVHLGNSIPLGDLAQAVRDNQPHLVGLSASYLPSVRPLVLAVDAVREMDIPVLVGGSAFNRVPGLWQRVGAAGHGPDARAAAVVARKLAR